MDWSLVLLSQGIESVIDQPSEGAGWGLIVAADNYETALATIRQYQVENRGWPWQQTVLKPGVVFDWASLAWVAIVGFFYWLSIKTNLESAGIMDSSLVSHGEWWRLFTAIWLHADVAHLATNATIGFVLLGAAMGRCGTGVGVLAAYVAGFGGNMASWLIAAGPHRSLGASGMVMGCLGLLAGQSLLSWRRSPHATKYTISAIAGGLMLFVLLALTPGTDVIAHLGGFVSGAVLGAALTLARKVTQSPLANVVCGFLFTALVVIPWWAALKTAPH